MTTNESTNSTTATARAIFDAIGKRDLDALAARYREHVVIEWLPIGVRHGRQANLEFWAEVLAAVPDSQVELTHLITEGDYAVAQWRWRGTFSGGPYVGIHATGKPVDFRGCNVMRFTDGLLAEETVYFDGLGWVRQIGMLPAEHTFGDKAMTAAFNARTALRTAFHRGRTKQEAT